jgi:MFS family permease
MHRRVAFLLFTAGWGANHFASLLIVYRRELGLAPSALGLLFGAYALGLVPGLILAGRASDARGRRALVLPATAFAIAASIILAFGTDGFRVLLAGRLLFGLAMGSIMAPGSVWLQELSAAEHGPRRATLALSAGFGLGPLVSGVIAELAPAPMITPYVVHATLMAIAFALVRSVPETAKRALEPSKSSAPAPSGFGRAEARVLVELLPVAPWAFGFAAVTVAILPGLMRPHVERPVLYASFVIVTTLFTGVLVQPLTTRIGSRADLLGLALGALGTFAGAEAVALGSPSLVFGAAVLIGAGYGLVITTGLREIAVRVPKQHLGTAVVIYYVLTYVGFALPFVHALVAKSYGDVLTLRVTAGVALGSLVVRAAIEALNQRAARLTPNERGRSA